MLFYADKLHVLDLCETRDRVVSVLQGAAAAYRRCLGPAALVALQTHPDLVGSAVALGELHQAVADHLNPSVDEAFPDTDRLAAAGLLVGRCVYRSAQLTTPVDARRGDPCDRPGPGRTQGSPLHQPALSGGSTRGAAMAELLDAAAGAVAVAVPPGIPPRLQARVPEGYAFYTLYPEMYLASLAAALKSEPVCSSYTVLGIRSIGASLATLVAGALLERGIPAVVETLRPRGHPFDRYVEMGPALRERLEVRARSGAGFVIVDEGPGLTCSSFLSVCSALRALGVEEDRMTILAAWQGRPSIYASDEARARWRRLRVFHTGADEAFDGWRALVPFVRQAMGVDAAGNGRGPWPAPGILDLSYGRWRERCYGSPDLWPAVHRATERTKVLFQFPPPWNVGQGPVPCRPAVVIDTSRSRGAGPCALPPGIPHARSDNEEAAGQSAPPYPTGGDVLAKFAGLGDYGREKLERATVLAEAGFSPPVLGLAYGLLLHPFVPGRPLAASDLSPALLARMVDYYSFIARRFPAPPAPSFDRLAEVILVNARESLGIDARQYVESWGARRKTIDGLPMARVDGKPQPYEWLEVAAREGIVYLKADSADHFHDHTLVGEQSILWDLAGACEDWEMGEDAVYHLLDLWERKVGDRQAASLLDFYRAAYLAFRVAALHYAVHSTDEEDVRSALQHQEWKYRQRLGRLISGALRVSA